MTLRDLVSMSACNLWRMKLRSFLTISGVVIAIAAFVSMLSFGAGMQENVSEQFDKLGLLSTMIVYPSDEEPSGDSSVVILDQAAIEQLASLPGVRLAYPFDAFDVAVELGDSTVQSSAQALPVAAANTKLFSQLRAGTMFTDDSAREVVVTNGLLEAFGVNEPDSIIGRQLVLTAYYSSLDSGLASALKNIGEVVGTRAGNIKVDSLTSRTYWQGILKEEAGGVLKQFMDGFLKARAVVSDTLVVRGVLKSTQSRRAGTEPAVVPVSTARRLTQGGFSGDPADLFAAINSGTLFQTGDPGSGRSFPRVTLDLDPQASYQPVRDSIKALGFRPFSYAEQFDEIRQFFLYFNMVLGVVGFIALVTASLGIVNTMVMSITERRREIGVLKSLGADQRDIRVLFLVESGVIGIIGAVVGLAFGWLISRVASLVARTIMASKGIDEVELFALPLWLIVVSLIFGLTVSLLAGSYPAARASRVDPVVALRNE